MENANTLPKVSVYPLLGIGIVSGLFAAMFGIGGGVVIVPLLMLLTLPLLLYLPFGSIDVSESVLKYGSRVY